jgi:hypothetical protein
MNPGLSFPCVIRDLCTMLADSADGKTREQRILQGAAPGMIADSQLRFRVIRSLSRRLGTDPKAASISATNL